MANHFPFKQCELHLSFQIFLTAICASFVTQTMSLNFNRNYTGVTFSVRVKYKDGNGKFFPTSRYTRENLRVMMEVIGTRFSRIMTYGMGHVKGPYVPNITYDKEITVEGHIAESAAHYNKMKGHKSITVLQGVYQNVRTPISVEGHLVLEAVERTHRIFPGTIQGVVYANTYRKYTVKDMATSLELYQMIKKARPDLPVGNLWKCEKLITDTEDKTYSKDQRKIVKTFITQSDFIICIVEGEKTTSFGYTTNKLLTAREKLTKINPRLNVMAYTGWLNEGLKDSTKDLQKFKFYWESLNSWANANKFPIWLVTAIQNPDRVKQWGYGWWKLTNNSKINDIDGYVEQVPDPIVVSVHPAIILYVALSLLGVCLCTLLMVLVWRKCFSSENIAFAIVTHDFNEGAPKADSHLCYEALKVPFNTSFRLQSNQINFDKNERIRIGHGGKFYKAAMPSLAESVALKMYKNCSTPVMKELLEEVKILSYLGEHTNVVKLHGTFIEDLYLGTIWLVLEYCSLGSLTQYLKNERSPIHISSTIEVSGIPDGLKQSKFSTRQLLTWSVEIVSGMEFLEEKLIVHGCMSCSSVLLTTTKEAKITGFNVGRHLMECKTYIETGKEPSKWRWLSPESLGQCTFSAKSDVWSVGVTIWEIFSLADVPYAAINCLKQFLDDLQDGLRLLHPLYGPAELYQVLLGCWKLDPELRPTFKRLKQRLTPLIKKRDIIGMANVEIQ